MPAVFCKHKARTVFIDWLQWSFRYEMLYIYRFLGLSLNVCPTNWCALQQNRVNIPGGVFSSHLLCLSIFSLPSSMNSLKVQLVLSSPTTELPRGCGRSASSITPSSGKNRSALMVGGFFVRWPSKQTEHFPVYSFIRHSCSGYCHGHRGFASKLNLHTDLALQRSHMYELHDTALYVIARSYNCMYVL